jgi:hypothetical protein
MAKGKDLDPTLFAVLLVPVFVGLLFTVAHVYLAGKIVSNIRFFLVSWVLFTISFGIGTIASLGLSR